MKPYVRSVVLSGKNELYERVVMPTVTYGAETLGMSTEEKHELGVIEMKCIRKVCGVTRMDRVRNEKMSRRVGVREERSDGVDRKVLRFFVHEEHMS